jgi:hypothetical protein
MIDIAIGPRNRTATKKERRGDNRAGCGRATVVSR